MTTQRQLRGITLIRLLRTLSMAAVTLPLAVPSLEGMMSNVRPSQVGSELMMALTLARSEAARLDMQLGLSTATSNGLQGRVMRVEDEARRLRVCQ